MKRPLTVALFGLLLLSPGFSTKAYGAAANETIASRIAEIDGVKLHYMSAGHGTLSYSCMAMRKPR
jgi:hypothetical protein